MEKQFFNPTYATSFSAVCSIGRLEIVKLLIEDTRIDINILDSERNTHFHLVCKYG